MYRNIFHPERHSSMQSSKPSPMTFPTWNLDVLWGEREVMLLPSGWLLMTVKLLLLDWLTIWHGSQMQEAEWQSVHFPNPPAQSSLISSHFKLKALSLFSIFLSGNGNCKTPTFSPSGSCVYTGNGNLFQNEINLVFPSALCSDSWVALGSEYQYLPTRAHASGCC